MGRSDDTMSLWSESTDKSDAISLYGKIKYDNRLQSKRGGVPSSASSSTSTSRVNVTKKKIRVYKGLQGLGIEFTSKKNKIDGSLYGLVVKEIEIGGVIH